MNDKKENLELLSVVSLEIKKSQMGANCIFYVKNASLLVLIITLIVIIGMKNFHRL